MRSRWCFVFVFCLVANAQQAQRELIDRYCVTCHNAKSPAAGLALDSANLKIEADKIPLDAATWDKVLQKVKGGFMPPAGMPRPNTTAMNDFTAWIEGAFDRAALAHPNPGRVVLHRLNRAEYANVIRDLLALNVDAESLLPPTIPTADSTTWPILSRFLRHCSSVI